MIGYATSFVSMFEHGPGGAPVVDRVEVPLIQRDYAQGRKSSTVDEVRRNFLDVLHDAVSGGEPVGLDFVYGEVNSRTLRPLDGQQRLTTLFLLHWYLVYRMGGMPSAHAWSRFAYETRPSARLFCERLADNPPPADVASPSAWITDQEWYLYVWGDDPTIQSMLTVIDAIHERLAAEDASAAWQRLTDTHSPAVSFYLLPIEDMGSGEELYIKMNSRGKPLTPFENLKARLERTLAELDPIRAEEFAHKVDGQWSDLLWPIHGGDNIVDDEFMRYLEFVTEICEWRENRTASGPLEPRTRALFSAANPRATEHLDFGFNAFDVWVDISHIRDVFQGLFSTGASHAGAQHVVLFGNDVNLNLFEACCHTFGDMRGKARAYPFSQSLILYAVLLHLIGGTEDFTRRLRSLRNLLAASENEVRRDNMPKLTNEVERLINDGDLASLSTFNQTQVADESRKKLFLSEHPHLENAMFTLEDHPILRGSLIAFELEPATFESRAEAFGSVFSDVDNWPLVTGALLAAGEYQRRWPRSDSFRFGTGSPGHEGVWRDLFTGTGRSDLDKTQAVLARLLDLVAASPEPVAQCLQETSSTWLREMEHAEAYDWRYHLVRYDCMRAGESGLYQGHDQKLGYSLVMLRKTQLNSKYRDAFLNAIWRESCVWDAVEDPWFTGYAHTPRWLTLSRSRTKMRSGDEGIALQPPTTPEHAELFSSVCARHSDILQHGDGELLLVVRRQPRGERLIDAEDRVQKGAAFLRELVDAGL